MLPIIPPSKFHPPFQLTPSFTSIISNKLFGVHLVDISQLNIKKMFQSSYHQDDTGL